MNPKFASVSRVSSDMRRLAALALTLALVPGCRSPEPAGPRDPTYATPGARLSDAEEQRLFLGDAATALGALGPSDVVFVGTVERVEPSPGFWSGIFAVFQVVHYRVEEVHRGTLAGDRVAVEHPIVGPPLTEPETPELSHRVWYEGARLLITAAPAAAEAKAQLSGSSAPFGPLRADGPAARRVLDGL